MKFRRRRDVAPEEPAAPSLTVEEAQERFNVLRARSPRTWRVCDPAWLNAFASELADVVNVLSPGATAGPALDAAVARDDAGAWFDATKALFDIGLGALSVALMTRSVELQPVDDSIVYLALALARAERVDEAARVYRTHPAIVADSGLARLMYADCAAMAGDLATTRALLPSLEAPGQWGPMRDLAFARVSRADALGDDTRVDSLRWWDAALNGMLLLHRSDFGQEDMHGRYAVAWDNPDQLATIVASLLSVLDQLGRRPTHVVAGSDRDSQVLGHFLALRLGVAPPQDPTAAPAPEAAITLVAQFDWAAVADGFVERYRTDTTAVLFAYWLDAARAFPLAPDVAGLEAQYLSPAWAATMRLVGEPGGPQGAKVVDVAADDRPPAMVAGDLASTEGRLDGAEARVLRALADAARRAPQHFGVVGGHRESYQPGGPVTSSRFTDEVVAPPPEPDRAPAPTSSVVSPHVSTPPAALARLTTVEMQPVVPSGWFHKVSVTLLRRDGQANLIASSEPLDPSIGVAQYAATQEDLLRREFAGFVQHGAGDLVLASGEPVMWRHFSWHPPGGVRVTQLQMHAVARGRGHVATCTSPSTTWGGCEETFHDVVRTMTVASGDGDGRVTTVELQPVTPVGWYEKVSVTLLRPDGQANLIASSEPVDPAIDTAEYAAVQGDLLAKEFSRYVAHAGGELDVVSGERVMWRQFSWQPPQAEPVTQIQLYAAGEGRGLTATGTAPVTAWSGCEETFHEIIRTFVFHPQRAR